MIKRIAILAATASLAVVPLVGSAAHAAPTTPAKVAKVQLGMTKQDVRGVLGARGHSIGPAWKTSFGHQLIAFYRVQGGDSMARVRYFKPKGSHHFYVATVSTCDKATWVCTPVPATS